PHAQTRETNVRTDFTTDKCPTCPSIPSTMPSSARMPVQLRPNLSSRELICSTEPASEGPLHPLVDRRTRTNAQQGAWLALQRAESRPRNFSLDHLSGSLQRDVERQERHVAEETLFRTRATCLCCPSIHTSPNVVISTFSQTNEFT